MVKLMFLGFPHRGTITTSPYISVNPETTAWKVGEVRTISSEAADTLSCHHSGLETWGKMKGRVGFSEPSKAAEKKAEALKVKEEKAAGANTDGTGGNN